MSFMSEGGGVPVMGLLEDVRKVHHHQHVSSIETRAMPVTVALGYLVPCITVLWRPSSTTILV